MKQITSTLVALAILALPAVSFANTYQYVDNGGRLQSTVANSPTEAIATAFNISPQSGVMLVSGGNTIGVTVTPITNTGGNVYKFIDIYGNVQSIHAVSSAVALATAINISPNSGVMLVN
jgi:hypothetical protein